MLSGCRRGFRGGLRRDERELFFDVEAGLTHETGDGGGVEAGGIVFDAERAGFAIKTHAADAVDLTRVGQRKGDGLGWRSGVAVEDVHGGHKEMIARCGWRGQGLEVLEVGADLGVGPVGGANEFAADDAFAVDGVGLGPHIGVEEIGGGLVGIAHGDEIDVAVADEAGVGVGVLVNADGENDEVWIVAVELEKRGDFFNAGSAPGGPEVEQYDFAAIAGEMDRSAAVGDGEVGCDFAGLRGMGSAVAAGDENSRERSKE